MSYLVAELEQLETLFRVNEEMLRRDPTSSVSTGPLEHRRYPVLRQLLEERVETLEVMRMEAATDAMIGTN